ncbi:hypothetical protein A3L09_01280 [Thermococcus profundus]|uniref:DUF835 domain-containing protein n=1 Tax=Thermococcus profundus TaxID=49899 RepID=A0A2Z2MJ62_THEPR|nr:DUF835 domain-containing protein [Thermococcus profundus]ASJ01988.1 hypothetical protein A3L09_01280 [Thermococcus profundus]
MGLIVSSSRLIYDISMFAVIAYVWLFFLKRWNRYVAELKFFVQEAAIFLSIAVIGRTIDIIDDFTEVPYDSAILSILYGVSIFGVIYTIVHYVIVLERRYIPTPKIPSNESAPKGADGRFKGAYLVFGSKAKMVDLFGLLRSLKMPTLAFTRNPHLYEGMDFVATVWITQATDSGVPPTKLHVIQEQAINFVRENPESIVVIDCLEYLMLYNEFPAIFKFLVNLKDYILPTGAALVIVVDENALDERQKALLLREFEPL